jgi:hypothetical protein
MDGAATPHPNGRIVRSYDGSGGLFRLAKTQTWLKPPKILFRREMILDSGCDIDIFLSFASSSVPSVSQPPRAGDHKQSIEKPCGSSQPLPRALNSSLAILRPK